MSANVFNLSATSGATTITLNWSNPNDIPPNQSPCSGNRRRKWFVLRRESWDAGGDYTEIASFFSDSANPYNAYTSYVDTPPAGGPWSYIVYAQDSRWRNIGEGECEFSVETAGDYEFLGSAVSISGDDDPAAFNFTNITGTPVNDWGYSNTVTLSGMASGVSAIFRLNKYDETFVVGGDTFDDNAEIRKNGGSWQKASIYVENGDTVQVRLRSDRQGRTVSRTVYIGGVTDTVSLTTVAQDITPDPFTFIDIPQAELGTQYFSNTVTLSGMNSSVTLNSTIVGAMISKNGGPFLTGNQSFTTGDTIQLYLGTATTNYRTATVTMGSFTETWVIGQASPPVGEQEISAVAFTPSSDPISFNDIRQVVGPDSSVSVNLSDWLKNGGYWDTSFAENVSIPTSLPLSMNDLKGRKGEWVVWFPYGFSVVANPNLQGSAGLGASPIIPPGQNNPPLEVKFTVDLSYSNGANTITGDGVWEDISTAGVTITRSSVGESFGTITMQVRRKGSSEDVSVTADFNLILRHTDEEY